MMAGERKILILCVLTLCSCLCGRLSAQEADSLVTTYTDEYLDSVQVRKKFKINDYTMIGVHYGVSINNTMFTPPMRHKSFITPGYFGFSVINYGKMFGYMPYFGFRWGFAYGHEGYQFKMDKEDGSVSTIEGATKAVYDVVEMPFLAHMHYDMNHFKMIAELGPYAGYKLRIERSSDISGHLVPEEVAHTFLETDKRWDYGLQGGLGVGFVFDPVELHINATVRYSWSTIYAPNYKSEYYYNYAYPFDVMISAGLYFQLTKRSGKTSKMLRHEAREMVFNPQPEQ